MAEYTGDVVTPQEGAGAKPYTGEVIPLTGGAPPSSAPAAWPVSQNQVDRTKRSVGKKKEGEFSNTEFLSGNLSAGFMNLGGMPADTLENALNLMAAGIHAYRSATPGGKDPGVFQPPFRESPLTSPWLKRQAEKVGISAPPAESAPGRYAAAALQAAPSMLAARPTPQQIPKAISAGATSGVGAQAATDIGGPEYAPLGAMLPAARGLAKPPSASERATTERQAQTFEKAKDMGIPIPPRGMKPNAPLQRMEDTVTKDLRLPPGTELSPKTLNAYSAQLYKDGYEPLAKAAELKDGVQATPEFQKRITALGDELLPQGGQKQLPETFKSTKDAIKLLSEYGYGKKPAQQQQYSQAVLARNPELAQMGQPPTMAPLPTATVLRAIRNNRAGAVANLASDKPEQRTLGKVQKEVANALEDLIDQNLAKSGNQQLIASYRDARTHIAKAHDVLEMIDPQTGKISPARAASSQADRPLSGGLKDVSDVARQFPGAVRPAPASSDELFTKKVTPMAVTHPGAMGAHWATRMWDPITTSSPYQHFIVDPRSRLSPEAQRALRVMAGAQAVNVREDAEDEDSPRLQTPPPEEKKKDKRSQSGGMTGVRG